MMRIGNKEFTLEKFATKDSSIWVLIPTILYTKDDFFLNEKKEIRYLLEFQFLTLQLTLILKIEKKDDTQDNETT